MGPHLPARPGHADSSLTLVADAPDGAALNGDLASSVTSVASGPYEAWQVVGCVLCLVAVTVVATARLPLWIVVPVVPVAFTAAWALTASSYDTSGLWALGAVLVLAATFAGTVLVGGATAVTRWAARGRARVSR